MQVDISLLQNAVSCYNIREYPALLNQITEWSRSRPLAGCKVLEATPLFRNTLVKYIALLSAGAELTAGYGGGIPFDREILALVQKCGIAVRENGTETPEQAFDLIFDCGGVNANITPRYGTVELTRSGAYHYGNVTFKVFLADAGKVKHIETSIGTGDGLVRGLAAAGITLPLRKGALIFGAGKVGCGIAANLVAGGTDCTLVDTAEKLAAVKGNAAKIPFTETERINTAVLNSDIVISATGRAGALAEYSGLCKWVESNVIFANMGVEDEYGPLVPAERVLNNKEPLNFILEEPTLLRYIDPTMALSNAGAIELLQGRVLKCGLNMPPAELEEKIIEITHKNGCISAELDSWKEFVLL